jgi:hypothetical protein
MEIFCRDCRGNAFRILPAAIRTVTAECLACGTLTWIEIPQPDATEAGFERSTQHRHSAGHERPIFPRPSWQTLGNL